MWASYTNAASRSSTLLRLEAAGLNASLKFMAAWFGSMEEFHDIHSNTSGHAFPIAKVNINCIESGGVAEHASQDGYDCQLCQLRQYVSKSPFCPVGTLL